MLSRVIENTSIYNLDNEDLLREVMVKIGLKKIDMQEGVKMEALLNSGTTGLVMSSEFAKRQGFKLKKMERFTYIRNVNGIFNKERPIKIWWK